MQKNERATCYHAGKPTYYSLSKIPPYLASKTEWVKRGYRVPTKTNGKFTRDMGNVEYWQGMEYLQFSLFHLSQCVPIRGEKAKARRQAWEKSATYSEDGE